MNKHMSFSILRTDTSLLIIPQHLLKKKTIFGQNHLKIYVIEFYNITNGIAKSNHPDPSHYLDAINSPFCSNGMLILPQLSHFLRKIYFDALLFRNMVLCGNKKLTKEKLLSVFCYNGNDMIHAMKIYTTNYSDYEQPSRP